MSNCRVTSSRDASCDCDRRFVESYTPRRARHGRLWSVKGVRRSPTDGGEERYSSPTLSVSVAVAVVHLDSYVREVLGEGSGDVLLDGVADGPR